jgi:bifunctional non-homologous end joining protein LigD
MNNTEEELILTVDKHQLKLTHLNKLYWPEDHIYKKDLIDYYAEISTIILPYLIDRPESMHRFPNGIGNPGFYQKNAAHLPDWIETKEIISDSGGKINYILCQNKATLLYLANLGCIEMHPWFSRIGSLENPDFCVLDLDPEKVDFTDVIKTALAINHLLESLGIPSYCKTSGSRGLHICIPLGAKYAYEQSVNFAQIIATLITRELPDITSLERLPSKRQGKVYIDCLQNRFGQTLASAYSVRPRLGATVSTPLQWDELVPKLRPEQFTIKNTLKRIEKYGDFFKPVLGKGIDLTIFLKKLQNKVT